MTRTAAATVPSCHLAWWVGQGVEMDQTGLSTRLTRQTPDGTIAASGVAGGVHAYAQYFLQCTKDALPSFLVTPALSCILTCNGAPPPSCTVLYVCLFVQGSRSHHYWRDCRRRIRRRFETDLNASSSNRRGWDEYAETETKVGAQCLGQQQQCSYKRILIEK